MRFLQIIRWKNLLLIVLIQILIKYYLLSLYNVNPVLSHFQFVILVLATLLITIGGNIINDIFDVEIDKINKPNSVWITNSLVLKKAKTAYLIVTIMGLLLGISLSIQVGKPLFILLFLIPISTLYFYSSLFKRRLLVGNFIVSFLIALSIVVVALFENLLIKTTNSNFLDLDEVIIGLAFFAFILNFAREIIKDMEDELGDRALGVVSFPIKYGKEKTHLLVKMILSSLIGVLFSLVIVIFKEEPFLAAYLVFAVIVSLFFFINQVNKAKQTSDYHKLSTLLKLIMLVGILSVFMINPV